ncbi:hypothetical protein LINPERPRIM_LOCUS13894 [Linum perenne]
MKAFDSVHWGYLFNILEAVGFLVMFLSWLAFIQQPIAYHLMEDYMDFSLQKRGKTGGPFIPLFVCYCY